MSRPFSSCCPGGRLMWVEKGVKALASSLFGSAVKPGANGRSPIVFGQSPPPGDLLRANSLEGLADSPSNSPDHGVRALVALFGPQVGGLLRAGGLGPLSMLILKLVKGTCGRPCGMLSALPPRVTVFGGSSKPAVSWPVFALAMTLPIRRASTL